MARLNSYQKAIAQIEGQPAKIKYTAKLRVLTKKAEKFIEPFDAESDPSLPGVDGFYKGRLRADKLFELKPFNKTEPIVVEHSIRYLCDFETEEERLQMVEQAVQRVMAARYKNVSESIVYGKDYTADIEKVIL